MKYIIITIAVVSTLFVSFTLFNNAKDKSQLAQVSSAQQNVSNTVKEDGEKWIMSSKSYVSRDQFISAFNDVVISRKQRLIKEKVSRMVQSSTKEDLITVEVTFSRNNSIFNKSNQIDSVLVAGKNCLREYTASELNNVPVSTTPTTENKNKSKIDEEREKGGICSILAVAHSLEALGVTPKNVAKATDGFKDPNNKDQFNSDVLNHIGSHENVSQSDTQLGSIADSISMYEKSNLDDKKIKCEVIKIDGKEKPVKDQIKDWCKKLENNPKVNGFDKYDYSVRISFRDEKLNFDGSAHIEKIVEAKWDEDTDECEVKTRDGVKQNNPGNINSGPVPRSSFTNIFRVDAQNIGMFVREEAVSSITGPLRSGGLSQEQICCTVVPTARIPLDNATPTPPTSGTSKIDNGRTPIVPIINRTTKTPSTGIYNTPTNTGVYGTPINTPIDNSYSNYYR